METSGALLNYTELDAPLEIAIDVNGPNPRFVRAGGGRRISVVCESAGNGTTLIAEVRWH